MIEAVIFDLDDTLYDEIEYCRSGMTAAAYFLSEQYGHCPAAKIFEYLWYEFSQGNRKTVFNSALDKMGVSYTSELINRLVEVYRTHKPNISLPEDSLAVLNALLGKYKLGLITDGYLPAQRLKVQALGIEKYFNSIIYTEAIGREFWKPSIVPFENALKELNATPKNTVYVADNVEKDFVGPNKIGMHSVQVKRPNSVHYRQTSDKSATAEVFIDNFLELPSIIKTL